jgi:hypothetical protein
LYATPGDAAVKRHIAGACAFIVVILEWASASSFPLAFSAVGAIGAGYYRMDELNRHLGLIAQDRSVSLDGITGGVNFRVEGRVWVMNQIGLSGGYEHFWAATDAQGSSSTLSFRVPADVYTVGAIVAILRIENVIDLCIGANSCFARSVYGTNEIVERRLSEFKGDNRGYEIFAEAHTNFLNPIEIGFQLGYRGLTIDSYTDKYGREALFEPDRKMQVDYSGVFFYLMTGIRI